GWGGGPTRPGCRAKRGGAPGRGGPPGPRPCMARAAARRGGRRPPLNPYRKFATIFADTLGVSDRPRRLRRGLPARSRVRCACGVGLHSYVERRVWWAGGWFGSADDAADLEGAAGDGRGPDPFALRVGAGGGRGSAIGDDLPDFGAVGEGGLGVLRLGGRRPECGEATAAPVLHAHGQGRSAGPRRTRGRRDDHAVCPSRADRGIIARPAAPSGDLTPTCPRLPPNSANS